MSIVGNADAQYPEIRHTTNQQVKLFSKVYQKKHYSNAVIKTWKFIYLIPNKSRLVHKLKSYSAKSTLSTAQQNIFKVSSLYETAQYINDLISRIHSDLRRYFRLHIKNLMQGIEPHRKTKTSFVLEKALIVSRTSFIIQFNLLKQRC